MDFKLRDQPFHDEDPIWMINDQTKFKHSFDSPRMQEQAVVWLFKDITSDLSRATINVLWTLFSKEANKYEGGVRF